MVLVSLGKRKAPTSHARVFRVVKRARAIMGTARFNRRLRAGRRGFGFNRRGVASKETGFVDLAAAAYAADTTGSITLIATIAQGASVNQRVGKKILLKSIQIRGNAKVNAATLLTDLAYLIVYDKRPTGALPAITDILVTANSNSLNNDANSGRFKILKRVDEVFSGNATTPATGLEIKDMGAFLKLPNLPVNFKAAGTGAIGDIEMGALYLVTVGDSVAGTAAGNFALAFRTRFVDI